jgi:hypothetical protein
VTDGNRHNEIKNNLTNDFLYIQQLLWKAEKLNISADRESVIQILVVI